MTRRSFLQTAAHAILTMHLGGLFSSRTGAAAPDSIRHLRQIVTTHPGRTRMIQWDSPHLLTDVRVEVRSAREAHAKVFHPAYTYLSIDGSAEYIYHAEIPVPAGGGAYRIVTAEHARPWISLTEIPEDHVHFLVFSDSQCGEHYDVWRKTYHAAWQRHPSTDLAALIGDLVDNGESNWHWQSFFDAMEDVNSPLSHHVHAPALGNHEYYSLNWTAVPPARYLHTFALPKNGNAALHGRYYSFDIGPVHCIVLDTQFLEAGAQRRELMRVQLEWLNADAAKRSASWNIVLMHKDILSYGEYQPEQKTDHGISDVGQIFLDTFDALGIDLVISGHVHAYRRRQIHARQSDPKGVLYLLAGPAGNQYFDVPPAPYDLISGPNPSPSNYLYMEADIHELRIRCESLNGDLLDALVLHK